MGNCMRRHESSSAVWAGDDWGSMVGSSSGGESVGENEDDVKKSVKIKMTRKEVEELVAAEKTSGLSMEQLLANLINNHNYYRLMDEDHSDPHKSWTPTLQTIPELD